MNVDDDRQFDVLIIGGGNAGISAAARLIGKGVRRVGIVEPQQVHTYRPLLSYVGGGEASLSSAERSQRSVIPQGCTWLRDSAVAVDAPLRTVQTAANGPFRYDDLIIGTGLEPDTDELPGIDAALSTPGVASNYLNLADKTWDVVQAMPQRGRAVFTVPRPPVSCTGTTVKPLFLAAGYWRRTGRLAELDITLVIDRPEVLGVPALDDTLSEMLAELNVRVLRNTAVVALKPEAESIAVEHDGIIEHLPYDMLHLVPPFRGPQWLQTSSLTAQRTHGLVDIDPRTLRHRSHPNIWAAGDVAAVDTDPSGGALRRQIKILVDNLLAARSGRELTEYDGYTVAPVATDSHQLIAGEFDRSGAIASSLPSFVDSTKPRWLTWAFDRYVLPQMYWQLILKGRL
jgi:sulfide:quinone oxidoreductase